MVEEAPSYLWCLRMTISRRELASWGHPDMFVRKIMKEVHDLLYATFNRGK